MFDQLEELQDHPAEREKLDVPEKGLEKVIADGEKILRRKN